MTRRIIDLPGRNRKPVRQLKFSSHLNPVRRGMETGLNPGERILHLCARCAIDQGASRFSPELADFYAFLAEIRNCPGVMPAIRLK
jgi:hypothetical protein